MRGPGAVDVRLPLLSAFLLALSFPPLHLLLPPFLALVPLAVHVAGLSRGTAQDDSGSAGATATPDVAAAGGADGRRALAAGALTGGASWALLLAWVPVALARLPAGTLPAPRPVAVPVLFAALVAVLALVTGGVAWTLHRLLRHGRVPLWLALPLAWTAGEWLRGHLPGGLAFPWLGLAASLTSVPEALGIAEWVGASGVTFWIALTGGLVAELVVRAGRRPAPPARTLLLAVAVVLLAPPVLGVARARSLPATPVARVAVVQPGRIDPRGGGDPGLVDALLGRLEPGQVDLALLPEGVLRGDPRGPGAASFVAMLSGHARRLGAPVVFGASGVPAPGPGTSHRGEGHGADGPRGGAGAGANGVWVATGAGLEPEGTLKRRLVPFVETPGLFGGGIADGPGRATRSTAPVLRLTAARGPVRAGVLVCYESSFPGEARRARRAGARLLLSPTNDGWFGGEPWFLRTPGLWQHPAHLVLRAVENRVGIARAASTGISFFVDPVGRVHQATALGVPAVAVRASSAAPDPTLHARTGDLVGPASLAAVLVLLLAGWRPVGRR